MQKKCLGFTQHFNETMFKHSADSKGKHEQDSVECFCVN